MSHISYLFSCLPLASNSDFLFSCPSYCGNSKMQHFSSTHNWEFLVPALNANMFLIIFSFLLCSFSAFIFQFSQMHRKYCLTGVLTFPKRSFVCIVSLFSCSFSSTNIRCWNHLWFLQLTCKLY